MARAPRIRLVTSPPPPAGTIDELFRSYARYVASIGLRTLGRPHEVDDFVQDVFLQAHRGLRSVREPAAIKGWLASIAVRLAMRRLRQRRLFRFVGLDDYDYGALADPSLGPEERAALAELHRRLDVLPAAARLAWTLRHVEGERLEEVAALCGCSLATAKRRIAAAEEALHDG